AAGIMGFVISLLVGTSGSADRPRFATAFTTAFKTSLDPIIVLGMLLVLVGFGFKISAVPFHFWCPDVFEGAAAEVAGFLSVASKGAGLALLGRFAFVLAGLSTLIPDYDPWLNMAQYLGTAIAM